MWVQRIFVRIICSCFVIIICLASAAQNSVSSAQSHTHTVEPFVCWRESTRVGWFVDISCVLILNEAKCVTKSAYACVLCMLAHSLPHIQWTICHFSTSSVCWKCTTLCWCFNKIPHVPCGQPAGRLYSLCMPYIIARWVVAYVLYLDGLVSTCSNGIGVEYQEYYTYSQYSVSV